MTQQQALEILKTGRNVFVTGPAGSGKTFLINSYIAWLKQNEIDVGITASTGIAATHMGGVTIHSWAGISVKSHITDFDLEEMAERSYLSNRFERVRVLIIDEVSMLHHFRLDLVDQVLKAMKGNSDPFGGLQVVLCGDFFQLPPVSRFGEPESLFIYESESWKAADFTICYLEEQFRQKNDVITEILNEIRSGVVSSQSRKLLDERFGKRTLTHIEPTKLFTHNIDVDTLNYSELEKLQSDEAAEYSMETRGKDFIADVLKKSCLAPDKLQLKVGARVMCVKNNFEAGYVNGTLGVVVSCRPSTHPVIRTSNGKYITLERASWKIEEDGKVKAEIMQYPLRLAWAITVHKSQGMSLDAVEVDLSKSFEAGMGYVALSRVRSLEGLTVLGMNDTALKVNEQVLEYDDSLRDQSEQARTSILSDLQKVAAEQKEFLEWARPTKKQKEKKMAAHEKTALLLEEKLSLKEIAAKRELTTETVVAHIERLIREESRVDLGYLRKEISPTHWKKIQKAIEELVKQLEDAGQEIYIRLSPVKNKVGASVSFLHIRLARALLGYVPKKEE